MVSVNRMPIVPAVDEGSLMVSPCYALTKPASVLFRRGRKAVLLWLGFEENLANR
jgi:hypothetical protein